MTEDNKMKHIQVELSSAEEAFRESVLLFDNGFPRGAVSRLYYSLFHMIRALLASEGLEPRSHDGAERLFSLHFVQKGLFHPADARTLAILMKYRSNADYKSEIVFAGDDYPEFREKMEALSEKIRKFLKERDYIGE